MGFNLTIGGQPYEMQDFNVQEAATPLAAGDSSGQVGTISFQIPAPDPELSPNHPLTTFGASWLVGKQVRLDDTRKGFTLGKVSTAQRSSLTGLIQVTATSRTADLNVYNIQAQPFSGTLEDAFEYYLSLANVTSGFAVDPSIAVTPVIFPGWNGDLWYNLKRMALAVDCDISLVSGVLLLRPIRTRLATKGRDIERSGSVGGGSLAQYVEVYQYNNRTISGELVYPPGGWSDAVTVLNVNSGETIVEPLQLSASVTSIVQPVMQTFVSRDHSSSSVFTAVGDDGLPIDPAAWEANGGRLSVEINPDTVSLTVTVTAPTGLPNKDGAEIGVYGIALSSDDSTGRYSTLRIIGSGVAFNKEIVRVPTGITPQESATEVGVTIDNPFLSNREDVYRAGIRAVRGFNGSALSITGTVSSINRRGDSGGLTLQSYGEVQTLYSGLTYADVQTLNAGLTYTQVQESINAGSGDLYENQAFGNVAGARVWDASSARWYRIRTGTFSPSTIQFEAEDDLLHSDVQDHYSGLTYGDIQTRLTGFSYREVDLIGLR